MTAANDHWSFDLESVSRAKATADFLGLTTEDVARLAQVAMVVWDETTPQSVIDHVAAIEVEVKLVVDVFEGDLAKAALWFTTPNPFLGEVAPVDMIRVGKLDKLKQFISSALSTP